MNDVFVKWDGFVGNLFSEAPSNDGREVVQALAVGADCRIERIVSRGQASPEGFWYDQDRDEWVALLSGAARLRFEDGRVRELAPGDHVHIPAHCRHRVDWTAPGQASVWIAVHFESTG